MTIPLRPNVTDDAIEGEFGANSKPWNPGGGGLFNSNDALDQVFPTYTVGDLTNIPQKFAGTSQPAATIGIAENVTYDGFTMVANISNYGGGGTRCYVRYAYDITSDLSSPQKAYTSWEFVENNGDYKKRVENTEGNEIIEPGTTYYYQLEYYNGFIINALDHKATAIENTTTNTQTLEAPQIDVAVHNGFINIYVEFNYTDLPNAFTFEFYDQSQGQWANAPIDCSANFGTATNPKKARLQVSGWSGGDPLVRAKAESPDTSKYTDSPTGNEPTVVSGTVPACGSF